MGLSEGSRPALRERPPLAQRLAALAGVIGLCVLVAGTVLAWTARFFWIGELVANLRWQLSLGGFAAAALLALGRRSRIAAPAALLALLHAWPALALGIARPDRTASGPSFTVASANLWYANTDAPRVRAWLQQERIDVVACFEVGEFWMQALAAQNDLYPHQVIVPPPDRSPEAIAVRKELEREDREIVSQHDPRFGLALLSRFPLKRVRVHEAPEVPDAYIEADLVVGEARVRVVALHPERPGLAFRIARRNATLEHVARTTEWTERALVVGDLNVTLYSPAFQDLVESAALADSRAGFGRQPTWNPPYGLPGEWLDLDHVLVRSGLAVLERRVGPDVGSDHRPVVARVAVR